MISDRDRLARTPAHETALACIEAGIEAALPERAVASAAARDGDDLHVGGATYDLAAFDRVLLFAVGKAAPGAARTLREVVEVDGGLVVTDADPGECGVECIVGGHPLPDAGSVRAGERALALLREADERTLVLAAVTGGGSALLEAPAADLSLEDLRAVTAGLLEAGAPIDAINAVRKHCSRVKGGRLAGAARPATVAAVVVSDVVGDDLATIASGPFAPDPTTYDDAIAALPADAPAAVRDHLRAGARGEREETPGPGDSAFDRVRHEVVANGRTAVAAAREAAAERGYATRVLGTRIEGEASEVGRVYPAVAAEALESGEPVEPPAVVLAAGETTVTVRGDGEGGPNAECALSAARALPDGAVLGCVDTDGRDGGMDAAGAVVDAAAWGADAGDALARNDAGGYLARRERDALVETGATGTNVNDLHVLVV